MKTCAVSNEKLESKTNKFGLSCVNIFRHFFVQNVSLGNSEVHLDLVEPYSVC